MSRGGLFLVTDKFLPIGAVAQINVDLPEDGPRLRVIARVAYVLDQERAKKHGRKPGMGLQFLDVAGRPFAEQIADYIKRLHAQEAEEAQEIGIAKVAPARILVVDDVASQRSAVAEALSAAGHEVLLADNGVNALGQALKHQPDLILSDVEMPALDGWQLVRLLRARPSLADTPIVFLTSLSSDAERLRGYRLGVDDYIAKPFAPDELRARIGRVLGRARDNPRSLHGAKALRGALEQVSVPSLLSFLALERRTGRLLLVHDEGMATLWVREGQVLRVSVSGRHAGSTPLERALHVLDWNRGRFELADDEVEGEDELELATAQLLLEHARRHDEVGAGTDT